MAATKRAGDGQIKRMETLRRVYRAEALLARQHSTGTIVRMLAREYGVDERSAWGYVRLAWQQLQNEDADADQRAARKLRARRTWQGLLRSHMLAGDRQAANYAMDRLCRLDGLYAPEKIQVTSAIVTAELKMDQIIGALDDHGIEALQVVLDQLEAKGIKALPPGEDPEEDEDPLGKLLASDGDVDIFEAPKDKR